MSWRHHLPTWAPPSASQAPGRVVSQGFAVHGIGRVLLSSVYGYTGQIKRARALMQTLHESFSGIRSLGGDFNLLSPPTMHFNWSGTSTRGSVYFPSVVRARRCKGPRHWTT
jgi:hypothetical protein